MRGKKQLPGSHFISSNDKGVAISIDALLAMVLFIAMITFISVQPIGQMPITQANIESTQIVDDAIAAMDNTGTIMRAIEDGNVTPIEEKLKALLPNTIGFKVQMLQFESTLDDPISTCRADQTYESCFPNDSNEFFTIGENLPTDKEIFHGRKIFIKKEPGDCAIEGAVAAKDKWFSASFAGEPPEARDVNITIGVSCPSERNPCPETTDTMRCCYEYYDAESDPETAVEYQWYRYDEEAASGDGWTFTGNTAATQAITIDNDGNRFKCKVRVSDGTSWGEDVNSPLAIIGGPCFFFDSSMTNLPMECDKTSNFSFTVSAESGGRKNPVDIMISMDRSGSMSWMGRYSATGTERSTFFDSASGNAFVGTTDYVYKMDVNQDNGGLSYTGQRRSIDDARGLFVDDTYVYVANDDTGVTVLNKGTMALEQTVGSMTTARSLFVEGDYIYVAAAGTVNPTPTQVYGASMTGSRNNYEMIGYDSARKWISQSFTSDIDRIDGVRLYLYRRGNPVGDLTIHIRASIDGPDLNGTFVDFPMASVRSNGYRWETIDFPWPVDVNIGQTYYIVLTTTDLDTGDYYRLGSRARSTDQYTGGAIYRCNTSDVCTAVEPPFQSSYEDGRFRIYKYDFMVGGLVIIDKSHPNPDNWTTLSNLYDTGSGLIDEPEDVVVSGDYAYIADRAGGDGTEGLWIVDVSDKASPSMTGFVATTNPQGVVVDSNNYAYLADEDGGLRIIDISNKASPSISTTLHGGETIEDVAIYDTNVYTIADIGLGAMADGIHVVDASDPPNAIVLETFYSPYDFYKFNLGPNYFYMATSYGLITADRIFGTKMNFARNSAKQFVNFEDWESPEDKLGVVSYGNGNSSLDHFLADADIPNKATISTAIDGILSEGGTPMHLGLDEALDEILDSGNGRADAVQFIILLADGQSDFGTQDFIDTQVARAKTNEVYIFSIGFGGDVDDVQMENIALDAYCPDIGDSDCGSYHHITDPEALLDVYNIIAERIAQLAGRMPDKSATDISMQFDGLSGLQLSNFNPSPASWAGGVLTYEDLNIKNGWTGSFDVIIPCNYPGCDTEFIGGTDVFFPPENTQVGYALKTEPKDAFFWPMKYSSGGEFYFNDLELEFISGQFFGTSDTALKYKISNKGYLDIDLATISPTINFYEGSSFLTACADPLINVDFENFTDVLDSSYGTNADGLSTSVEKSTNIANSGYICIWVNKDQDVAECSYNNYVAVNCAIPKTFIYTLDYWAWEK